MVNSNGGAVVAEAPSHINGDGGMLHDYKSEAPVRVASHSAEPGPSKPSPPTPLSTSTPAGPAVEPKPPALESPLAPQTASPTALDSPTVPTRSAPPRAPAAASSPPASHPPHHLISTHLISNPTASASQAIRTQFPKPNPVLRLLNRFKVKHSVISGLSAAEEKRWQAEGPALRRKAGWKLPGEEGEGVEVGELFWKMYLSLMPTLGRDPLSGLCPPDLLGSTTTMPLSIISLIPDIMQHYHDVIIRAEKEIFLATNYWQPSNSVNTISQSLRDLSALVVKEKRPKIVVKIMYDRGSWEQLWNAHAPVSPKEWTPLDLPAEEDIEGLHMEVINFHRVLLGTFHAKFLIVDRKVALLNSNNIQDRPNLELMSHLEGPVVDAFYEIALHSWYNQLSPPLPCMNTPYQPPRDPATGEVRYLFSDHNPYFDDIEILKAARAARMLLRKQTMDETKASEEHGRERFRDAVRKVVDQQRQSLADWHPGDDLNAAAQSAMQELREFRDRWASGMMGSRVGSRAGSRSNSRAPSRRASSSDVHVHGKPDRADSETAAITAANAALNQPEESEAPSSPTMTELPVPIKSKTMPPPQMEEPRDHPKHHVMFLDTDLDGTGRLFQDGEDSPLSPRAAEARRGTSPRMRPAASPRMRPAGSPRMHPADSPRTPTLRLPPSVLGSATVDSPTASSIALPRTPVDATMDEASARATNIPTNLSGEPLPPSAQTPKELQGGANTPRQSIVPSSHGDHAHVMNEKGDEYEIPPEALKAGLIRWDKVGGTRLQRADSDVPPEGKGSKRMYKMSKMFNAAGVLSEAWATVEDSDEIDNFRPHIVHKPHGPLPIAMCCRKPHGFPGHHDIRNPQNAAWLAGFRYAKKKVFVQSPTLNARPIVRAVKQACRRGVEVVLLLDLGFNDKGESIPFQGGTNEEVVDRLYKKLRSENKEQYLKVYWYTGKDQVRPLNAVVKQRNCHIKFAAYDDEVLIIGNGNQDSQSWFHSQEVNVMIDSKQIVAEMMETLLTNQNTIQYGLVDSDGVWRDDKGKTLQDYGATGSGAFRGLSGFIAFAKTI